MKTTLALLISKCTNIRPLKNTKFSEDQTDARVKQMPQRLVSYLTHNKNPLL